MEKAEKRICTLAQLPPEEFWKLKTFLATKLTDEEAKDKEAYIDRRMRSFFPKMTAIEEAEFQDMTASDSDDRYLSFQEQFPSQTVDLTGTSPSEIRMGWELELETINMMYFSAVNQKRPNSQSKQIMLSMTLANLERLKPMNTFTGITALMKKYPDDLFIGKLTEFSKYLTKAYGSDRLLGRMLAFCYGKPKNCWYGFLSFVVARAECVRGDASLSNPQNVEFNDKMKKLSEEWKEENN